MSAIDIFGLLVPVTYLVMLGIEALFPARAFPPIRYWRLKGFCFLTVQGLLATLTPLVIPEHWLAAHRLINLEGLGVVGGAVLGYIVVSLVSYVWHRSAHTFAPMWRLSTRSTTVRSAWTCRVRRCSIRWKPSCSS